VVVVVVVVGGGSGGGGVLVICGNCVLFGGGVGSRTHPLSSDEELELADVGSSAHFFCVK
jgi:hypothetical protein